MRLQEILDKAASMGFGFENMTLKDIEQFKVDTLNETEGNEHEKDGYHCSLCRNKGYVVKLIELKQGGYSHVMTDCKCSEVRRSILRMKKSGLKDIIKDYTFDKFDAKENWQQTIKQAAQEYAKAPSGWFFIGGQSGCGKTHLCTAICREFLLNGKRVVYMLWRDDIAKLKALAMEPDQREAMINRFKKAEVLYIDDLFKTGKAPDGTDQKPTSADINTAFEIINYRYNNPDLLTVISSEWGQDALLDIDEAIGGRIFERAKTFNIAKDRSRNYRTRGAVTL